MKTFRMLFLPIILSLCFIAQASASSIIYAPPTSQMTIEAGYEVAIPLKVTVSGITKGSYYLWFKDTVSGNMPSGWLTFTPATTFVTAFSPAGKTVVTISVPSNASPGVYTAHIFARAMGSHDEADKGTGFLLEVTVPARCPAAPGFEIASFGPSYLWPPDHGLKEVSVSGRLILPDGCTLLDVAYSIDDEYGVYTSAGSFSVETDGSFVIYLPVEASRHGYDKDGRHYSISIFAEDEAGVGTVGSLNVLVPHDMRNMKK